MNHDSNETDSHPPPPPPDPADLEGRITTHYERREFAALCRLEAESSVTIGNRFSEIFEEARTALDEAEKLKEQAQSARENLEYAKAAQLLEQAQSLVSDCPDVQRLIAEVQEIPRLRSVVLDSYQKDNYGEVVHTAESLRKLEALPPRLDRLAVKANQKLGKGATTYRSGLKKIVGGLPGSGFLKVLGRWKATRWLGSVLSRGPAANLFSHIEANPKLYFAVVLLAGSIYFTWPTISSYLLYGVWIRFEGEIDQVTAAAISPDGSRLLVGSYDGVAGVWDMETGKQLQWIEGHHGIVVDVAISPDGRYALSAEGGRPKKTGGRLAASTRGVTACRLWDLATGKRLKTIKPTHRGKNGADFLSGFLLERR